MLHCEVDMQNIGDDCKILANFLSVCLVNSLFRNLDNN